MKPQLGAGAPPLAEVIRWERPPHRGLHHIVSLVSGDSTSFDSDESSSLELCWMNLKAHSLLRRAVSAADMLAKLS